MTLPDSLRRLVDAVLRSPGRLDPATRRAIEANAAALGGREEPPPPLPAGLAGYVEKVAKHAYKTTDEDIEALRRSGYSEDDIFEITVSAALGAGIARWERGIRALKGASR